jgi:hypothetical protein
MVDLNGHEAGNGGHSQGKPTAYRVSSTGREACCLACRSQTYNLHLGLLRPEPFWLDTAKSTRSIVRPASL